MKMDIGDGGGGGHNYGCVGAKGRDYSLEVGFGKKGVEPSTGLVGWVWYELIRSAMLTGMGW
jgi:hypothetical protein